MTSLENPFRSERIEALAFRFPTGDGWPALLARLAQHGGRGALVGPKGSGKTTALEELASRLRGPGRNVTVLRFSAGAAASVGWHRMPPVGRDHVLLVDGAEQLTWPRWSWLRWRARRAAMLVVTTHRPGRLPAVLHTRATPALLAELVGELAPGLPVQLDGLFERHQANLREVLRALYDRHAGLPAR